jgi:hypothetical protein
MGSIEQNFLRPNLSGGEQKLRPALAEHGTRVLDQPVCRVINAQIINL